MIEAARRLVRHRRGLLGGLVVGLMVLAGLLAPAIAPYSYSTQSLLQRLQAPSIAHWLGTDGYGRDVLTRVVWGSRVSLEIGFVATGLSIVVGTLLGGTAGYPTHYRNPRADEALEAARRTASQAERKRHYAEFSKILMEDAPYVFLYFEQQVYATRQGHEGFVPIPTYGGIYQSLKAVRWTGK